MDGLPKIKVNRNTKSKFQFQSQSVLEILRGYDDYFTTNREASCKTPEEILYAHQVQAVLKLDKYFDLNLPERVEINPHNSNIALVVLPTGYGKTGVAVLASYALNAKRVLVITPSKVISEQLEKAYKAGKFLLDRKIIEEKDVEFFQPPMHVIKTSQEADELRKSMSATDLTITNTHKISDRAKVQVHHIPAELFDLVIVDEAHHYPAHTWKQLVDHFVQSKKIFLTATPEHRGEYILKNPVIEPCFTLRRDDAGYKGHHKTSLV